MNLVGPQFILFSVKEVEMNNLKVAIIGAGAWGGALANVLADNGHLPMIWSVSEPEIIEINTKKQINALAKKQIHHELHENISGTTELEEAVKNTDYILMAVPSFAFRQVAEKLNNLIDTPVTFISATKGLEKNTHFTMCEIIEDVIDDAKLNGVVALSGPTHAEEVIRRKITAIVSAYNDITIAKSVQRLFNNSKYFRVYTNRDRKGVEIAAALKNVIAVISGMHTEYDLGDNAKAALITRGLFEIVKIGCAFGGEERTFSGLAGLGDLIVTTTSHHSRNFQAGRLLARNSSVLEVEKQMGATIEGFHAIYAANEIILKYDIYAPLISLLYDVITEKISTSDAIKELFNREMKDEFQYQ